MRKMIRTMLAVLVLISITTLLSGCKTKEPPVADITEARPVATASKVLAGGSATYSEFSQKEYDAALNSDKLILLYFYADWCPVCRFEVKRLKDAFGELVTDGVVGFQVNYNDKYTDAGEKKLAQKFGVAYQHTKVFLKKGERILKSPESWGRERYIEEINNHL